MKKTLSIFYIMLVATLIFIAPPAYGKQKAPTILILPFQVDGPANIDYLTTELPELLERNLTNKGITVIPERTVSNILKTQNVKELNLAKVRALTQQMHATYAVYGSIVQRNGVLTIDGRLVEVANTQPAHNLYIKKTNIPKIQSVIAELGEQISLIVFKKNNIADIQIKGLKALDPDVILTRLGISKGDQVDYIKIDSEIKQIWNLGYFDDVTANLEATPKGKILTFTVKEKPKLINITVEGSDVIKTDSILAAMSSKKGSVINDRVLAQDIQKITDLYKKEGYYLAEVTYNIKANPETGGGDLILKVKEGKKLYIKEVRIEGLEALRHRMIKKQLALTERGFLSWFTGTGVLREEYLERDSIAISAYAMNHGYIDVQVSAPEVSFSEAGISIVFKVNEGKRYKIGTIGFKGDLIDTDAELFKIIKLDDHRKYEEYFSLSILQDDVKTLTDFYSNYGYAFAEVDLETSKHEKDPIIDIVFVVDKKQKIFVRRINITGNARTRNNVILRELRLTDGELFNGDKLRRSNERLTRLRYFTQVDTEIVPTGDDTEVDLVTKLKEDRTGSIMGGVGYSTYSKFGVSGSITERNFLGRGYVLGLQAFTSGITTSLDLAFTNPKIFDSNFGFSNNTYITRDEWDDFRKKTLGNTITLFHPVGEYSSVSVGYRLDRYTLYDMPETAPRSYLDYKGTNISSVVNTGFIFDSTDSKDRPTRGYIARTFLEYGGGGLGGNDNFFKPIIEFQNFSKIMKKNLHVFHWRTRFGAVYKNHEKPVPVFNRFFIGGIDTIRGYDREDLTPKDPISGEEVGGDRIAFANFEYIWTFQPDLGLSLVPFFDIGFQIASEQTNEPLKNIKRAYGLELRWRSPMGDLRFAYGIPLDDNVAGERTRGRFEFSMGQFF